MKKIYFLAAVFVLLGCNHVDGKRISFHEGRKITTTKTVESKSALDSFNKKSVTSSEQKQTKIKHPTQFPPSAMLDVVLIKQNPELRYGCEVTSLAMVLQHAGAKTNKMELYRKIKKDPDPLIRSSKGDILKWGDPQDGFVGDMTGKNAGYAVFDKPIEALVEDYLPGKAVNLTGRPFEEIILHVAKGYPVVVWTTGDFRLPDRMESWVHGSKRIVTPLDLHAVVLVGFDQHFVYLNDPLSGKKQSKVPKQQFIASWRALHCRAVSYK